MKKQPTIEELKGKVKTFYAEQEKLLKKLGIARRLGITFPRRKRVPLLSKIARAVIVWQGGVVDDTFGFINNKK